jgi:PAS domain S-box-containing protein
MKSLTHRFPALKRLQRFASRPNRPLLIGIILADLLVVALAGFSSYTSYVLYRDRAASTSRNTNRLVSQSISGEISLVDIGLNVARDEYIRLGSFGTLDQQRLTEFLKVQKSRLPMVDNIRIADREGRVVFGSDTHLPAGVSIADRQYFAVLRDSPADRLMISEPVVSHISNAWVVVFARRIDRADGSFDGVIYAPVTLDWFNRKLARLEVGAKGAVVLRGDASRNFDLLARFPPAGFVGQTTVSATFRANITARSQEGTYEAEAGADNILRIFSYRQVDGYPLITLVGLSTEDTLAGWWRELAALAVFVLVFMMLTALAARSVFLALRDLEKSEKRYRRLVDTANEGIWALGPDGRTNFVNDRMTQMLGYSAEEMLGNPGSAFMFEEDVAAYLERMASRQQGMSEQYETRFRRKDGQALWAVVSATPVFEENLRFEGSFGMVTDITERKQAEQALARREQAYRTVVENIPQLLVRYDTNLCRTYVSPSWQKASGLSASEVVGKPAADIARVPNPVNREYLGKIRTALETGTPQLLAFEWVNAYGTALFLEYAIVPEFDREGRITGVLCAGHDLTERKRVEEELRRHREHLEELVGERTEALQAANREMEAFSYSVSHDLRTPLRAIDGYSRLLEIKYAEQLDGEAQRLIHVVRSNAARMGQLIDDILAFSRAGRSEMRHSHIDMERLVNSVWEDLEPDRAGRELQLTVLPLAPAQGDPTMLRQVWINLLGNAIKFTRSKAVAHVEVGCLNDGDAGMTYYVKDDAACPTTCCA